MSRNPCLIVIIAFIVVGSLSALQTLSCWGAEQRYAPDDPFAAIDGEPIFLGELNLILTERLRVRDMDRVSLDVKRATAALLVRRHLAMKSLQQQGGRSLAAIVDRRIETFAREAARRGSSLAEQAKSRLADETSLKADIRWRTAWGEYLKSQLNETNLRRFFGREHARYAGGRWRVSQIFVDMDSSDGASVEVAAMRMKELADQVRASGSVAIAFAEAARQHSDAGSASDGGMIGWVEKEGDLPASVMNAVRETAPGKVSEPVDSPLGMHLVFVHESEAGKLTFDELSDQGQLRRDAADALFDALVRRQSDAKIVWFIGALKPPQEIRIIPD